MNDDLSPLEPGQLDELLSAELDGELDAAGGKLGTSVEGLTARVNATPGADARRAVLAQARDLLSAPPAIDELLAQRLRAKAVRAAAEHHAVREIDRRRRRRQMFLGASGIAAAAVAVVALAGGLGHNGGSNTASEKSSANAAPAVPAAGSTGKAAGVALGSYSDKRVLAAAALVHVAATRNLSDGVERTQNANGSLAQQTTAAAAPANSPAAVSTSRDASPEFAASGSKKAAADAPAAGAGSACPTPAGIAKTDKLVLRATATLAGKPVIVFVFSGPSEHAVEIEDTNCALIEFETTR